MKDQNKIKHLVQQENTENKINNPNEDLYCTKKYLQKKKKSALEILLQAQIKSQHTYISEHKLKALYNSIRTDKNDNR